MASAVATTAKATTAKRLKVKFGPRVLGYVDLKSPTPIVEDRSISTKEKRCRSEVTEETRPTKKQKTAEEESKRNLCSNLLRTLMEHQYGWAFSRPVDPKALNLSEYFAVISEPMDLGTVESRLKNQEYGRAEDFGRDVRLTFSNAMMYAPKTSMIHRMASALLEIFEERWNLLDRGANDENPKTEGKKEKTVLKRRSDMETSTENTTDKRVEDRCHVGTSTKSTADERAKVLKNQFKNTLSKAKERLSFVRGKDIQKERKAAQMALNKIEEMIQAEDDNLKCLRELQQLCGGSYKYMLKQFGLFLR